MKYPLVIKQTTIAFRKENELTNFTYGCLVEEICIPSTLDTGSVVRVDAEGNALRPKKLSLLTDIREEFSSYKIQ